MDLITGLSGSGPAYFYYIVELMKKTAVTHGLSDDIAKRIVVQTLFGAAKMLKETGEDPEILRKNVTSPNGTTFAALQVFESRNLDTIIEEAVLKAANRSSELGKEYSV